MQKIITNLIDENMSLLDDARLECFILQENLPSHFKAEFALQAAKKNKITLGLSVSDCLAYRLDGIILDLSKSDHISADYKKMTEDLKNKFIGVITRNRRHEAMLVSECEPDFVIFRAWQDGIDKINELTSWYHEMFLIQSALLPMEDINYQSFQTDFVILDSLKQPTE
ncbi:MAG: hypothetical protein J6W11_04875 [Alphaproteobacteria bacterium]|nr:hypothetical protein [Alphaproteobacteria bacterium]